MLDADGVNDDLAVKLYDEMLGFTTAERAQYEALHDKSIDLYFRQIRWDEDNREKLDEIDRAMKALRDGARARREERAA